MLSPGSSSSPFSPSPLPRPSPTVVVADRRSAAAAARRGHRRPAIPRPLLGRRPLEVGRPPARLDRRPLDGVAPGPGLDPRSLGESRRRVVLPRRPLGEAGHGPEVVGVVAPAPPAYKVETVPQPPGAEQSSGSPATGAGKADATSGCPGGWETRRAEEVWVPAHWVRQRARLAVRRRALAPLSDGRRQRGERSSGGRPASARRFAAAATIRFQFSSSSRQAPMRFRPSGGPW